MHTLVSGSGAQHGEFDALDYRKIKQGDARKLGNYPVLSVLQGKSARCLYEYHAFRFENVDLLLLPTNRSDFDVHCVLTTGR